MIYLGTDEYRTRYAGECRIDTECPAACHCERTTVDCSARGLVEIPRDVPLYTTELYTSIYSPNSNHLTKNYLLFL